MGLVPASEKYLTVPDTGVFKRDLSKMFNGELRNLQSLQKYVSQLEQKMDHYWAETFAGRDPAIKVGLGGWLFDMLSRSMGAVFWGEEGSFEDS
ncbi:Cytochrome P450 [Aspergillus sp. HF37]|nr:Cytochrome P450 [Aspergillus sp. HF37]